MSGCCFILYIKGFKKKESIGVVEDIPGANAGEWDSSDLHAKTTL